MVKVPIWAYYCMNSCVTTRARSTRVKQYCHFVEQYRIEDYR